ERHMGLGSVNDFSLAEAREKALECRKLRHAGIDPIEDRIEKWEPQRADDAQRITFKQAVEEYIQVHEAGWKNQKHRDQWIMTLKTYTGDLPVRPVGAITDAAINEALAAHWKRIPDTASRTKQRILKVLKWIKDG